MPVAAAPGHSELSQEPDSLFARGYAAVTAGLVASILLTAFEALAVGTAMPVAVADLKGLSYYALASTAFATASLLGMVHAGVRSDSHGPRLPYLGGIAVFGSGLLLAGTAQSMAQLVAGRAVQGLGGGMTIVALYVLVGRVYPEALRAKAFSLVAALWVMPSVVGPLVAGTLTEHLSWRWVFLGVAAVVPIPILLLIRPLAGIAHPVESAEDTDPSVRRTRMKSAALASLGVGLLQFASQDLTWVAVPFIAGAVLLLVSSVPKLLPRGTLRAMRGLPTVILMRGVLAGAYFGAEYYVPLMLVEERRTSPTVAGLTLVGTAFSWALAASAANRAWIPWSRETLVRLGAFLAAGSIAVIGSAVLQPDPALIVALAMLFSGFGMGLVFPTLGLLTLRLSAPEEQGVNSSSLQIADGLGNILLTSVAGAAFHALHGPQGSNDSLFVLMFGLMAAAAVAAALLAPRVRTATG